MTATIARNVRSYFAPVNRETGAPSVFDPAQTFNLDTPPSPWIDTGEVREFRRTSTAKFGALTTGQKGAAAGQFRCGLEARLAFDFCEWGKLQMAIAGGSQHMNVLEEEANTSAAPSGGAAASAVAVLEGSSARELLLGVGAVDAVSVGDWIAVDLDYMGQTGYVGSGISGAYVNDPADVLRDRDYLRRVTFNVAKVVEKTATSVVVDGELIGGEPPIGASLQKVVGFVDREGGGFFQEWSALFVVEGECGGTIFFHYPRLQAAAAANEREFALDSFAMHTLHAEMLALPVKDLCDGETVECFRSWRP